MNFKVWNTKTKTWRDGSRHVLSANGSLSWISDYDELKRSASGSIPVFSTGKKRQKFENPEMLEDTE